MNGDKNILKYAAGVYEFGMPNNPKPMEAPNNPEGYESQPTSGPGGSIFVTLLSGEQILQLRSFLSCPWFDIIKLGIVTKPDNIDYQILSEYYDRDKKMVFTKLI